MSYCSHTQYPVGQGGLHLGIIGDFAYIYDCGSVFSSRCSLHIIDIVSKLRHSNIIKVHVFISHLHADHCSTLPNLLKRLSANGIHTHIYVPYITPLEKIYLLADALSSFFTLGKWYTDFIIEPKSIVESSEYQTITSIIHSDDKRHAECGDKIITDDKLRKSIGSYLHEPNFMILPFVYDNFDCNKRNNFYKSIKNLFGKNPDDITNDELKAKISQPNFLSNLKEAYKLLTNINFTSLCVYAGPTKSQECEVIYYQTGYSADLAGWLHTGDYNLKDTKYLDEFIRYYKNSFMHVGIFQIPHHGSANNISERILSCINKNTICFMTGEIHPKGKKQPKRTGKILEQMEHSWILSSECPYSKIEQTTP